MIISRCPLCSTDRPEIMDRISSERLVREWKEAYGMDVSHELAAGEITLVRCQNCDFRYFSPICAGSMAIYEQLQQFPWYYMAEKWEYSEAIKDIRKGDRVLEIGCGSGMFLERLRARGVLATGIELSASAASEAKRKGLDIIARSLEDLAGEETDTYDVICSFQVLEHVPNPRENLSCSIKLAKTGGRVIFGVPNADSFLRYQWNILDMPPHHVSRWTRSCLGGLGDHFPVRLERLELEPLAPYHIAGYIDALANRTHDTLTGNIMRRAKFFGLLRFLLNNTPLRRACTGQTQYACYSVTK